MNQNEKQIGGEQHNRYRADYDRSANLSRVTKTDRSLSRLLREDWPKTAEELGSLTSVSKPQP